MVIQADAPCTGIPICPKVYTLVSLQVNSITLMCGVEDRCPQTVHRCNYQGGGSISNEMRQMGGIFLFLVEEWISRGVVPLALRLMRREKSPVGSIVSVDILFPIVKNSIVSEAGWHPALPVPALPEQGLTVPDLPAGVQQILPSDVALAADAREVAGPGGVGGFYLHLLQP